MAAKVVLVEPDPYEQEQFANAIKGSAFEVCQVCETNAEAIDGYDDTRPHLLVLRMVSGRLGAAAALDRLRKKQRSVKVVASYDVRSTHLLMAAYNHGAAAAIKRPFGRHRVVEKLTFAIASERHDRLNGPIVRLEHPVQVRYRGSGLLSRGRVGFCERLGLTDMDLNVEKQIKPKTELKLELLLPPPTGPRRFAGVVEEADMTRPKSWCLYIALKSVPSPERKAIEAFIVTAAKQV